MTTVVDGVLFGIVAAFSGKDPARQYLTGVHIAPNRLGGVTLTATDGKTLIQAWDQSGHCDQAINVRLAPRMLKALKPMRETRRIRLSFPANGKMAEVQTFDNNELCTGLVDNWDDLGTDHFPADTIPRIWPADDKPHASTGLYCADLAKFLAAGKALCFFDANDGDRVSTPSIDITPYGNNRSVLVRFSDWSNVAGIIMPLTHPASTTVPNFALADAFNVQPDNTVDRPETGM